MGNKACLAPRMLAVRYMVRWMCRIPRQGDKCKKHDGCHPSLSYLVDVTFARQCYPGH